MGLKGKIAALAVKKAKELVPNEIVDNTLNSILNKTWKASGMKLSEDLLNEAHNNCLIVKQQSFSAKTVVDLLAEKNYTPKYNPNRYQVVDTSEKIKYTVYDRPSVTAKSILEIYDAFDNKLGYITEHLMAVGIPLLEKDVKKCTVYLDNEPLCTLKSCYSIEYSSKKKYVEALENHINIRYEKDNSIELFFCGRKIAILHAVQMNFGDCFTDKFIVDSYNQDDEILVILLTIAISLIAY